MNTKIENIYKKMNPDELALISFKAIATQDADLMDAIEANVKHKIYVGRDIDYSQNLNNRVNFAVWFGLQYHNIESLFHGVLWMLERETNEGGIRVLEDSKTDYFHKLNVLLVMANQLCDEYRIDKKTFLGLAQVVMTVDELEAVTAIRSKYLGADTKKYSDDMSELFSNVLNQNYGSDE